MKLVTGEAEDAAIVVATLVFGAVLGAAVTEGVLQGAAVAGKGKEEGN